MEDLLYDAIDEIELVHVHNKEVSESVIEMEHGLDSSHKVIDHLQHLNDVIDGRELVHVHNKELLEGVIEMEHELDNSRKVIDHLQHLNSQNTQNPSY